MTDNEIFKMLRYSDYLFMLNGKWYLATYNINVDMGNFIITTKLKTSDMHGTAISFLVIKNINETQTV